MASPVKKKRLHELDTYVGDTKEAVTLISTGGKEYKMPVVDTSFKRGTGGGNFSFNYPDNKTAKNACGKMGKGVYWKTTIQLDNAKAGVPAVVARLWTNNLPCMEDGTLVPYQFVVDYIRANNNTVPSVAVWLICMGIPTHLMDITDGTLKKLQRVKSGLNSGLDDLFPEAPDGEYAQEPQWRLEYIYA